MVNGDREMKVKYLVKYA